MKEKEGIVLNPEIPRYLARCQVREFWRQKATSTEDPTTKRPVMAAPCKENKMAARKWPRKERMTSH